MRALMGGAERSVLCSVVTVTGRVLVQARGRRLTTSRIWQDLLTELNKTPHVDLAYPTTRFFRADLEGPRPDIT